MMLFSHLLATGNKNKISGFIFKIGLKRDVEGRCTLTTMCSHYAMYVLPNVTMLILSISPCYTTDTRTHIEDVVIVH